MKILFYNHTGQIGAEPLRRTLQVLERFCRRARALGAERIHLSATSAVRDASNRDVADYLSTRAALFSSSFRVSRFVLFSARASVGGGPYVVEADYPLAA